MYLAAKQQSLISNIPPETIPILIIVLSILALGLIIERMIYFTRLSDLDREQVRSIRESLLSENLSHTESILAKFKRNPGVSVVLSAIELRKQGLKNVRREMETEGYIQVARMERFLTILGTIATISPLMGVLGTVVGMIRTFEQGVGTRAAEVGISEALITTALGLFVAIPAYIFYNYFVKKKEEKIIEMETLTEQALEILDSQAL
jgi:biopolymer transport protein ExbB